MIIQDSTNDEVPSAATLFSTSTPTLLEGDGSSSTYPGELEHFQNSSVAPDLLPPEVLSHIFVLLTREVTNNWRLTNGFTWLRVTHVCRHWRDVALNCPLMWSDLRRFVHPEITKLMLDRSKNAPLTVNTSGLSKFTPEYYDVLQEALSQTHRLRTVSVGPPADLPKIFARVTGPTPILKSLRLFNNRGAPPPLPPGFLGNGAPALEVLELSSFDVPWNTLPLPGTLTKLNLRNTVTRPLPSEIFESLHGLPLLEELVLDNYLPNGGFPSPLLLPSVKRLETRDSWARIREFLDVVKIPNAKRIDVTIVDFRHQDSAAESYVKTLKLTVQGILKSLPALSRFSVSNFDDRDSAPTVDPPCLEMGWDHAPTSKIESDDEPALEVALWLERIQTFSLSDALASINSHFNLTTVSTLVLDTSGYLRRDIFVNVLARLPNVQQLSMVLCPVTAILFKMQLDPAFKRRQTQEDGAKILPPYFPALRILVLDNIDFEGGGVDQLICSLTAIIKKRPESHQVKTLDIRTCMNIGTDVYTKLQMALPNVDIQWDEEEDWNHHSTERGGSDDSDDLDDEAEPTLGSPVGSV